MEGSDTLVDDFFGSRISSTSIIMQCLHAVPTLTNLADLMIKSLSSQRIKCLCYSLGMHREKDGFELVGKDGILKSRGSH